ncbi:MAG: hypothetical protein IPJ11_10625 [Gemmatimonadetes bacterium]|nr:hypothetical protein [Gemmatimonadota bacterium]
MLIRFATIAALTLVPASLAAQKAAPDITGTWRVDAGTDVKNGPREVIIRADSSASWGKETVRWRVKDGKIWIALGGEWEIYKLKQSATAITLSGGDLTKSVTLKKVGPATPRAIGVKVPGDPDVGS